MQKQNTSGKKWIPYSAIFGVLIAYSVWLTAHIPQAHAAPQFILPNFTGDNIGQFVKDLYIFSISIVGLAVFIQFLRAGFSYFFKAAGNASETANAKSMMTNAIIGAILLLSAYLILYVINPDLVNTNIFNLNNIKQCPPNSKPEDPCIPKFGKVTYAPIDPIIRSDGCRPPAEVITMLDNSVSDTASFMYVTVGGADIQWSAPGGNPDHGTGSTIQTRYSAPGQYDISVTSVVGGEQPINKTCSVTVKPYVPPTTEDTVARAKFAAVHITVYDGAYDPVNFKGINNLTVTQLIAAKGRCDNTAPCTMEITSFKDSPQGDSVGFKVNPSDAWLKRLQDCCTLSGSGDWTDANTGIHYIGNAGTGSWIMAVPGTS